MSLGRFYCLKREWDISIKPILSGVKTDFRCTTVLRKTFPRNPRGNRHQANRPHEIHEFYKSARIRNKNKHYAVDRKHNIILSRGISVVLSVCGLCSNLATMEVSCPMKNGRVSKLSTKGRLSRTRGPFLLLPSSQEELPCLLAFSRIVLFPSTSPVSDLQTDNISYVVFYWWRNF